MKLIVYTPAENIDEEIKKVTQLFNSGLTTLHLRKPDFTLSQVSSYINQIPKEYHPRIMLHSHYSLVNTYDLKGVHFPKKMRKKWWVFFPYLWSLKHRHKSLSISTSVHTLSESLKLRFKPDYITLSPVFTSISKKGYQPSIPMRKIQDHISKYKTKFIALGGVTSTNIPFAHEVGFTGVGLLGTIWDENNFQENFSTCDSLCKTLIKPRSL